MLERLHRDDVFVAGGQPSTTYVHREEIHVERDLARAIAAPNHIVSLSGPTKTGKTVLCRTVLSSKEYVWIDGGQISSSEDLWNRVCSELNIGFEIESSEEIQHGINAGVNAHIVTASGSRLRKTGTKTTRVVSSMGQAINSLTETKTVLVIDDFHYMEPAIRTSVMRNIKGGVFNGLKVVLLSVTHRAFDAIKAEPELTGRFTSITLPDWQAADLIQIPRLGFQALRVTCPDIIVTELTAESQENPHLMQKFCWEICYDCGVERAKILGHYEVPQDYDVHGMFSRIAKDAGLPVYQKLVAGPQSRRARNKRPAKVGEEVDIYQAVLLALAKTGPKTSVSYEEIRENLSDLLSSKIPQKHEVTSALKHLGALSRKPGNDMAIDWDESKREVNVVDPYLRFFLRWQVRSQDTAASATGD